MSGGYEQDIPSQKMVEEISLNYGVDEKTAIRIIADRNVFALAKFERWRANYLKMKGSSI
jgi:hypothetical protein